MNDVLSEREAFIIRRRYGIGGNQELTQREIARALGISRSYVSRIEKRALENLKSDKRIKSLQKDAFYDKVNASFSCMCLCKIPICWNEVNMYSQIRTSMLDGICAMPVQVEVDISMGMPVFDMVGYLSPEVREAKERVRTALHNCGILLPAKRITVNLSPANIRKTGTGFDLPIAVALLVAMGLVKPEKCADTIFPGS